MGKNKLSSGLINVVTYDTDSNISLNSGSNLLMSLSGSGTVTIPGNLVVLGGIAGSTAQSASYALNADKLDNLDSTQLVLTSSFNSYTSSASSSLGSLSSSVATTTSNLSSSVSSSIGSLSGSIATTTSGLGGRITTIEGNYATTGSNIFVGSQVITGSLYITNDMVVQGCSCLQNITASAVSIGTNTVVLNTATPAVRFAGISVQDSGSNAGVTGSIFWDGLCNKWVYSNPSGIGYSGGMLLSGPRTSTLGSESPLTCNYLAKSGGGDHLYDSCIQEVSGSVTVGGTLCTSGIICGASAMLSSTSYSNLYLDGTNATGWGNNIAFRSQGTDFGYIGSVGSLLGNTTKDMTIWSTTGNGFRVNTNGNNLRFNIDSAGVSCFACQVCAPNLLISNCATIGTVGFSYPEFRLAVTPIMTVVGAGGTSTGEGIYFKRTSDLCQGGWISGNGGALYIIGQNKHSTAFGDIYFATNNGTTTCDIMVISGANQRVGIGTPTPIDKFEVVGGIHTSGTASDSKSCTGYLDYYVGQVRLGITGPNTTTPAIFRIDQYSSNASIYRTPFYINTNGCVGISNSNPLRHLHIGPGTDAPLNPNNGLYVTNNGTTAIILRDSTNDSEFTIQSQSSSTILGTLTNSDLIIYTCNAERMRIANNGVTALCTNSALVMANGTVAQRPTPSTGMLRYNSDYNLMEFYNGTSWVQMGSGDLATAQCINNTSMCHSVYQVAGTTGLQGAGSGCISLFGAAAPSMATTNSGFQFATHGGHCGAVDFPGYWAVHLGGARAVNQLKVWIHSNSWGYFELQGSNNSGNASGFNQSGNWTTLSFLCSNNNNCQNMGGNASGCSDGTIFNFWYTNNVPFSAYRIKVLDASRPNQALGSYYGGSAGYVWQLNRV